MDTDRYIQFYATPHALPDLQDAGWCGTGWYYWDETEAHCSGPWEFVQPFLTREAAEQFRKDQAHNLGETRVYVESAYSNPEWKPVRQLATSWQCVPCSLDARWTRF